MSDISANLSLPYIQSSQAQKHVTHNEGMRRLDSLVQMAVQSMGDTAPPVNPDNGVRYILPVGATGDWAGQDGNLAVYEENAWTFYVPKSGWVAWIIDLAAQRVFDGSAWVSAAEMPDLQNVDMLGVATTADTTNRLAVSSDATLLTHAGDNHQLKVNKANASDTASLLFQTGWSGRAEMGTAGDDDFSIKVSADGSSFHQGLKIDGATGAVSVPNGMDPERSENIRLTNAGGADWWGAADPFTLGYSASIQLALAENRVHFSAFYVDRPLQLLGCFVAQNGASTTPGAMIRCGIYQLGAASGSTWNIGDLVVDFGALAADTAGIKEFNLAAPLVVNKGWYVTSMGVSGAGAKARYGRWLTPGLNHYYPTGSGSGTHARSASPNVYMYDNSTAGIINGGFPGGWGGNPVNASNSTNSWVVQMVFPKWREI